MNIDLDPYLLFGLEQDFTKKDLQLAYYELALLVHPDKGGSKEEMQTVQKAYKILKKGFELKEKDKSLEEYTDEIYENDLKDIDSLTIPSFMEIYEEAHDKFIQKFNESFDVSEGLLASPGYDKFMVKSETEELHDFPTREIVAYDGSQHNQIEPPVYDINNHNAVGDMSISVSNLCLSDYMIGHGHENIPDMSSIVEADVEVLYEKELEMRQSANIS